MSSPAQTVTVRDGTSTQSLPATTRCIKAPADLAREHASVVGLTPSDVLIMYADASGDDECTHNAPLITLGRTRAGDTVLVDLGAHDDDQRMRWERRTVVSVE